MSQAFTRLLARQGDRIAIVSAIAYSRFVRQATAFHGYPLVRFGKMVVGEKLAGRAK